MAGSPAWSPLAAGGSPPPARDQHTAIYDPVRDRMVVFGGNDGSGSLNDAWELRLAGFPVWSALTPLGSPPSVRQEHSAIYDPVRDRMVIFGNWIRSDVWALEFAGGMAWSEITPGGSPPTGRSDHTAIHDPVRDRFVVFGGFENRNDVWALGLAGSPAWSALTPAGSPPSGRDRHTAIYDPVRDRMVVFGGWDGSRRNDVWALSLAGSPVWSEMVPLGSLPSGRREHTAIYDPVRDRMVVFGGWDGSRRNDVWALSLAGSPAWSEMTPLGGPPTAREQHTAIYDPVRDRMVVFGGLDGSRRNDVWALSLAGSPAWSEITPAGSPPSGRREHTAIYEPVRDRMVVFGGYEWLDDVWALSLAESPAWSELIPSGRQLPGRYAHTSLHDPVRDRMVVYGGADPWTWGRNDLWALAWGPAVSAPAIARTVPDRGGNDGSITVVIAGAAFQSGASATLARSGQPDIVGSPVNVAPGGQSVSATFDLTGVVLGAWDLVITNPDLQSATLANGFIVEAPIAQAPAIASLVPDRGGNDGSLTVVIAGAAFQSGASATLGRSGQPDIVGSPVSVAPGGQSASATFDLTGAALGPWDLVITNPDLQAGTLANGFVVEAAAPPGFTLEGAVPNPAVGEARVWFTLPSQERAVLEVTDVAGRVVLRRDVGAMGPGRHSVDATASARRPGLYLLRLVRGGEVLRARMVVIR